MTPLLGSIVNLQSAVLHSVCSADRPGKVSQQVALQSHIKIGIPSEKARGTHVGSPCTLW